MEFSLIVAKVITTVGAVVGLSLAAEHASPKIAGLLSGYPMGAAIVLFFYGVEVSPEFAADSAVYTMVGMIGSLSFMFFYYLASLYLTVMPILFSTIISLTGFFIIAWLIHFLPLTLASSLLALLCSLILFLYLFRRIENVTIKNRIKMNHTVLLVRAVVAATIILMVIGVGTVVGPTWAGLFSAFPCTFLPLVLIVHYTYDREHVHTIIKNVPRGLGAVIMYVITVFFAYPAFGVYRGTLMAFGAATIYMLLYFYYMNKYNRKAAARVYKNISQ